MNPTVILAEDETCVRQTTTFLLRSEKVDVIAETARGDEALELCRRLRPTFLLSDLRLPVMDGVSILMRLRAEKLPIPVMIYTGCDDELRMSLALDAKPSVVVHKTDTLDEFRKGIRCAAQGQSFLSAWPSRLTAKPRQASAADSLTPAETELLKLLASGNSNKMAADLLRISEHTVANRRESLMKKLGAHEVTALVRIAMKFGLTAC